MERVVPFVPYAGCLDAPLKRVLICGSVPAAFFEKTLGKVDHVEYVSRDVLCSALFKGVLYAQFQTLVIGDRLGMQVVMIIRNALLTRPDIHIVVTTDDQSSATDYRKAGAHEVHLMEGKVKSPTALGTYQVLGLFEPVTPWGHNKHSIACQ